MHTPHYTNADMREKDGIIMQIQEFGQTPKQLFNAPHPGRNSTSSGSVGAVQVIDVVTKSSGSAIVSGSGSVEKVLSPSHTRRPTSTSAINNTINSSTTAYTTNTAATTKHSSVDSVSAQQQLEQLMISSEKLLNEKNNSGTSSGINSRVRSSSNTSHASSASTNTNTVAGEYLGFYEVYEVFIFFVVVLELARWNGEN